MNIPTFKHPVYAYRAYIVNIVDGDTIDAEIDVGFSIKIKQRLRLLGIDAYEMRGDERSKGIDAKKRIEELIYGKNVYIQTEKDDTGKYGRLLAWVWIPINESIVNINNLLLEEGHAVPSKY